MRRINKECYKKKVLQALKRAGKPIWVSELQKMYGLPYVNLHGKKCPAQDALRELEKDKKVKFLLPRYYKKDSTKPRRKICLYNGVNPRTYFDVELMNRITELEQQIKENTSNTSYNLTQHNMKDVKQRLINYMSNHAEKGVTNKQMAKHFGVSIGGLFRGSNTRLSKALFELVDEGQIISKKNTRRKGNPLVYYLTLTDQGQDNLDLIDVEAPPKAINEDAENDLMDAINNFLAIKKNAMLDEISKEFHKTRSERDYFERLCKQYKTKIDELETKQAKKWLNF